MDDAVELVNLTPHPITLTNGLATFVVLPSGHVSRVKSSMKMVDRVSYHGMYLPVLEVIEQSVQGIPPPKEGRLYVVSGIVAALADRDDVVTTSRRTVDKGAMAARALARIQRKRER